MAGMGVSLPGVRTRSSGQEVPHISTRSGDSTEDVSGRALRLKEATGLPALQGKGYKLRYLQGQENSTGGELAGERDRLI